MKANEKQKSLLTLVQEELGFSSRMEMLEEYALEGVVPGICRQCKSVEDSCEPDATNNWCSACDENSVVSILILAGLC